MANKTKKTNIEIVEDRINELDQCITRLRIIGVKNEDYPELVGIANTLISQISFLSNYAIEGANELDSIRLFQSSLEKKES